jgi:hypothetical protein
MAYMKRKPRCSWCYQEGHNRSSCPSVKQEAANGNAWAEEALKRSAIKKCSYCKGEDHIKSTCEQKFNDELTSGWKSWAGINAAINVIQAKKLAAGAFVYGPIMHRWSELPQDVLTDRWNPNSKIKQNYEMFNFSISEVYIDSYNACDECSSHFRYETLAEPEDSTTRLKSSYSIPGFYNAIMNLPDSFKRGKEKWIKDNSGMFDPNNVGRSNSENFCQVLVEAPQEEVDKVVNNLLSQKPLIVDFTDRKTYQSAKRKLDKANKNSEED